MVANKNHAYTPSILDLPSDVLHPHLSEQRPNSEVLLIPTMIHHSLAQRIKPRGIHAGSIANALPRPENSTGKGPYFLKL